MGAGCGQSVRWSLWVVPATGDDQAADSPGPRLRVLLLAPPMATIGGVQRYTDMLGQALSGLLGPSSVRMMSVEHPDRGVGARRLPRAIKGGFIAQVLRQGRAWHPDLVICTHVGLAPIGWAMSKLRRCPYWVVIHGREVWGGMPRSKRRALLSADQVLSVSNFTKQRVIDRHGAVSDRIQVLPCAVDAHLLKHSERPSRRPKMIDESNRVILTVGRLLKDERHKGHDIVLRSLPTVLSEYPNALYVILGDGDDGVGLRELARQLRVHDRVVFVAGATDEELVALYQNCEVFLLPARTVMDDSSPKGEGFGIVFLEAMAFGIPVIGPDRGAPAEFIRHGEHGLLVDPIDPQAVARATIQILKSPAAASRMGEAGRRLVLSEYSFERFKERVRILMRAETNKRPISSRLPPD